MDADQKGFCLFFLINNFFNYVPLVHNLSMNLLASGTESTICLINKHPQIEGGNMEKENEIPFPTPVRNQ